jgi:RNA polymerase sigma-70 factor (ECF subfamily)
MTEQEYIQDFEKLYDHFFDLIYRFVARRINEREMIHDIVSETFLKVYTHIESFTPQREGSLSSWIYTIAKNEIFQYIRKNKKKPCISLEETADIPFTEPFEERVDQEQVQKQMSHALHQLDEEDREIILYKYFDELNNIEIAALMHITANNVGVRLHRAMQKLKNVLAAHPIRL